VYAHNGDAVTYVMGEQWCWDQASEQSCTGQGFFDPTAAKYKKLWAREFRYDGARARYMNRKLNTSDFSPATGGTVWSDYDGDEIYGDFTVASASPWTVTNTDQYQPGMWRKAGTAAEYLHSDMLGTLRQTTGTTGSAGASRVFTAFGERITQTTDRFGYVGAYGYQSTVDTSGAEVFPFLHVGARYYDPSSGRFLQRDPIGLGGGSNVFGYVQNRPTLAIDPAGRDIIDWIFTGYWNPPPGVTDEAVGEFDKSNSDRTSGTLDFGVNWITEGILGGSVNSLPVFDRGNYENGKRDAEIIVGVATVAVGGVKIIPKITRRIGTRIAWEFDNLLSDLLCADMH